MIDSPKLTTGENALWVAVITTAINDCMNPSALNGGENKRLRIDSARTWLFEPNRDFNYICMFLGLEPSWVRAKAQHMIDEGKLINYKHKAEYKKREPKAKKRDAF